MIRCWFEKTAPWTFGATLTLGDTIAFLTMALGPYQMVAMWMDGCLVDRLAERIMEQLREDG